MFEQLQQLLNAGKSYDEAIVEMAAPKRKWLEGLLRREPFRPFHISMTSGSAHEVRDPELVRFKQSTVALCTREPNGVRESVLLALIHIVSITVFPSDEPIIVMERPRSEGAENAR
jgi:hypothetical protein